MVLTEEIRNSLAALNERVASDELALELILDELYPVSNSEFCASLRNNLNKLSHVRVGIARTLESLQSS